MKKILVSVAALMFAASVWAQTPEKMSYQAVVRDGSSKLITSHAVGMRVSVLQGSETGTVVYTETQTPTTNANGLVSVAIGSGIATLGKFADIDWSKGVYYIKTEIDPTGGTDYSIVGASQLLSVPYALYAKNAGVAGVKGEKGDTGAAGKDGAEGKSAYQIWIAAGNTGTEADFLTWLKGAAGKDGKDGLSAYELWKAQAGNESKTEADYLTAVKGEKGDKGDKGADGTMTFSDLTAEQKAGLKGETGAAGKDGSNGLDGAKGADGKDGLSAYQIWKAQAGNESKTEAEFLAAIKGEKGADGTMTFSDLTAEQKASLKGETGAAGKDGANGLDGAKGADGNNGLNGSNGQNGKDGLSSFELWKLQAGNESKTEAEFFVATKGEKGETGATGATGAKGADGAQGAAGKDGANGSDGKSAYQVAVANGYAGTEAAWLASLKGATGATGATGAAGATGPKGADGLTTSVNGVTQVAGAITLTKAHIGLDNAENTADLAKPISTATQTALDAKANKATTLAGYGITDAVATSGAQTIAGVKTFSDGVVGSLNANNTLITNVATPVAATDAATKAYVDALLQRITALEFKTLTPLTTTVAGVSIDLVPIPAGTFIMGSPATEVGRRGDETQHSVTLTKNFYMSKYEVTYAQYDAFCTATSRSLPADNGWGRGTHPVTNVRYDDAVAYCQWLSTTSGKNFRLPTEAEWEYAARAGSITPFNTGSCLSDAQANYDWSSPYSICTNTLITALGKTMPVGSYAPNAWGLHDMHGNVFEWCADLYAEYPTTAQTDPMVAGDDMRVIRGGCRSLDAGYCRSGSRLRNSSNFIISDLGFRLVFVP